MALVPTADLALHHLGRAAIWRSLGRSTEAKAASKSDSYLVWQFSVHLWNQIRQLIF